MNAIFWSQIGSRPIIWRAVACYQLARWLEKHNYTAQVIEFTHLFTGEELAEYTEQFISEDTLYVGLSTTMWSSVIEGMIRRKADCTVPDNMLSAIEILKVKYPTLKFIIGGPKVSSKLIDNTIFDYTIADQFAEDTLLKLTDKLAAEKLNKKNVFPRIPFNFDSYSFSWKEHDCIMPGETVPIELGRGCIFKCSFCRDPEIGKAPGTLEKNIPTLREEFIRNYEEYGVKKYYFLDETFNADANRVKDIADLVQSLPFELEWVGYIRLDLLSFHPETISILYDSGCRGALMGLETIHPEAAKAIQKPWMGKHGKEWLPKVMQQWKDKIYVQTNYIIGLPLEPEQHQRDAAKWLATESGTDSFVLTPLTMGRGWSTSFFEEHPDKYGIKFKEYTPEGLPYFENIAEYWEHDLMNWSDAYKLTQELHREYEKYNNYAMWCLGGWWSIGGENDVYRIFRKDPALRLKWWEKEQQFFKKYQEMLKNLKR